LNSSILDIDRLKVNFYTYEGIIKAIDDMSFGLQKGDTLGIVGETGCGKSVTMLAVLGLILPPGQIESGNITYRPDGSPITLTRQSDRFLRSIRGNEISMIFQEAGNALNPVLSIGRQVSESFLLHRQKELCVLVLEKLEEGIQEKKGITSVFLRCLRARYGRKMRKAQNNSLKDRRYGRLMKREAGVLSTELLGSLGIPNPEQIVKRHPHELSGGMQQRTVIAMALACNPSILIADEPTSNLDVTIQAQILDLIEKLKDQYQSSILFITHDLGVVAEVADKVIVLYAGTLVEYAPVRVLFKRPLHPYTRALLDSVPKLGKKQRLQSIIGSVPNLLDPPPGCRFHPRCPSAMDICKKQKPNPYRIGAEKGYEHIVACFLYKDKGV
jgi:peptide/nickel transport system ATP-binding protein